MPKNAQTTTQLHSSHTLTKIILKILQARLQQDMNRVLPNVQARFRKGRRTRDQVANIHWVKKAREFQKTYISALMTMPKPLILWIMTKICQQIWKTQQWPQD